MLLHETRFDAERTLALIAQHRISHAYLVPTRYERLLRLPADVRQRYDWSSMRYVASTGSPCPPDLKRAMIAWWGPVIHDAYVYPAEIEAVLQAMPGVADCAVFGVPDTEFGEALMAAVQPEPGMQVDTAAVQAFLQARLADYKVPRQFVLHAQLPCEDTGKVFKRRLREPYWAGLARRV